VGKTRDDSRVKGDEGVSLDGSMGQSVLIDELLFKTPRRIVDRRLHARIGAERVPPARV